MVGDEHADAALRQMADEQFDFSHRNWIDAGERLVEQHEYRIGRQRPGNFQRRRSPPESATACNLRKCWIENSSSSASSSSSAFLLLVRLRDFQHGADIFFDRKAAKNRRFLRKIANTEAGAAIHGQRGHVVVVEHDQAGIVPDKASDHVKQRRFAGAIWPQQANRFAALNHQAHVFDDLAFAVSLAQPLDNEWPSGRDG